MISPENILEHQDMYVILSPICRLLNHIKIPIARSPRIIELQVPFMASRQLSTLQIPLENTRKTLQRSCLAVRVERSSITVTARGLRDQVYQIRVQVAFLRFGHHDRRSSSSSSVNLNH